jgi:hypothetical protein
VAVQVVVLLPPLLLPPDEHSALGLPQAAVFLQIADATFAEAAGGARPDISTRLSSS